MSELRGGQLLEEVKITGGFGQQFIDSDAMSLRGDYVEAAGWNPSHTTNGQTIDKYSDSDDYDLDPNTLHLVAKIGSRTLACVRATPVARAEESLSWYMMAGKKFNHRQLEDVEKSEAIWDVTRLMTQTQLDHLRSKGGSVTEAIVSSTMLLGALITAVSCHLGKINETESQATDYLSGKIEIPDTEYICAVDPVAFVITNGIGIDWNVLDKRVINGDSEPTSLVTHIDNESIANASRIPILPLLGPESPFAVTETITAGGLSLISSKGRILAA